MTFSVVVPFRDTPQERIFAKKSLPSAARLKPDEIIVGMDKPVAESTLKYIDDIFAKSSYKDYKVIQIPRSDEWNFQLANVIWHCYKACRNDKILAFDIDTILRRNVLNGYDMVGEDGNAVVSFTKKLLIENISDMIRYVFYRYRVRTSSYVFAGTYWIWRPYYFDDVDLCRFKEIQNGIDTYMNNCVIDRGRHKIVTLKEIGSDSLDIQNEDMPWRQFQEGVWLFAHPETIRAYRKESLRKKKKQTSTSLIALNKVIPLTVLAKTFCYQHPWTLRGWKWAKAHRSHDMVEMAGTMPFQEWTLAGAEHVKDVYNWQHHGKTGTGFA